MNTKSETQSPSAPAEVKPKRKSRAKANQSAPAIALGAREVAIELIDEPVEPARFEIVDDQVLELAESIKTIGLLQPLVVIAHGERFEVVAGHRRLKACRMIGKKTVAVNVIDSDRIDGDDAKFAENAHRANLSPVEEAFFIARMIEKRGMKQNEIAARLCVSEAYVSQRVTLLKWPQLLQRAVDGGTISFSAARELAKITEAKAFEFHVTQAIENGVTPAVANTWWRDWLTLQNYDLSGQSVRVGGEEEIHAPDQDFNCSVCDERFGFRNLHYMRLCGGCFKAITEATVGMKGKGAEGHG